ncbi:unnamed protein product [Acanthoscelides obtectus]|uniref:DUF7869 domain-containing protein n=2 Tax=Acanthoscelides obtectus TaxID=200917 RepID=A0A9P0KGA4_ACAOB|nr:unnamed protein product [Acanthoscelides obtectus]CAK1632429.1 hypothetical protein AOBTE_LOCUS7559 [Acanthoscelides obtectus]
MAISSRSRLIMKLSRQLEQDNQEFNKWSVKNSEATKPTQEATTTSTDKSISAVDTETFSVADTLKTPTLPINLTRSTDYVGKLVFPGNMDNCAVASNISSGEGNTKENNGSGYCRRTSNEGSECTNSEGEPYGSDDSVADPDFIASDGEVPDIENNPSLTNIEAEYQNETVTVGVQKRIGRKRKSNKDAWLKNSAKRLRNSGQAYRSAKQVEQVDGAKKYVYVQRDEKKMGPPCNDKCRLKCFEKIGPEARNTLFKSYWEMGDLQRQRNFILSNMTPIQPKYRYEKADSCRRLNNAFYLGIGNEGRIRVCKYFFISTLGINSRVIRTVVMKQENVCSGMLKVDLRGKHKSHVTVPDELKNGVRQHIISIPRIESHYCRSQTQKEYIEGGKTISQLYTHYKKTCTDQNLPFVKYSMYYTIFNTEFNIGFFNPKKDQCELCLAFANANEENRLQMQDPYNEHITEKELARVEKANDKNSDKIVVVYDLQAVLPCPSGEAQSFYYVSKLNVFNFSMFRLQTKDVTCYLWHEGQGHRGANEIGSCVWDYLENLDQEIDSLGTNEKKDVVFYSDNCVGQQKNKFMVALYVYAVCKLKCIQSITHKFLTVGHTQNEGDSVHSVIERRVRRFKKNGPIYVPEQYVNIIRDARKTGKPYAVKEMCYQSFFDLKDLTSQIGLNINKIADARVISVNKDQPTVILMKDSFGQEEFSITNLFNSRRKPVSIEDLQLKQAYRSKPGITDKKKKGLLSLISKPGTKKSLTRPVPTYYEDYYKNL